MGRRATVAILAVAAAVAFPNTALAAQALYYVDGAGDSPLASCREIAGFAGNVQCDSLRAAVTAANANPSEGDTIYLAPAGDIVVNSALDLTDSVYIFGRGPRTTAVRSSGTSRVFTVAPGVTAFMSRFAVAGGRAGTREGGNILNTGDLLMTGMRVTGGAAAGGGGIANIGPGSLAITSSLIDHNAASQTGGGLLNRSGASSADVTVVNTTFGQNTAFDGGGIA